MIKDLLTRLHLVRQILTRADGTGAETVSDRARNLAPKHHGAQVTRSVSPYCAVACGQLVYLPSTQRAAYRFANITLLFVMLIPRAHYQWTIAMHRLLSTTWRASAYLIGKHIATHTDESLPSSRVKSTGL